MKIGPLITLLRRVSHSKYHILLLNNRMLMQCYSISEDSDIGLHYVLFIPPTDEYSDKFYDLKLLLKPTEIMDCYNTGHKILLATKKELKLKTKDVCEEFTFVDGEIKFLFYAQDKIIDTEKYTVPQYPLSETNPIIENCIETYYNMINRIKPGGCCVIMDGLRNGMFQCALDAVQINFYRIKINGKNVRIPLIKSLLSGNKSLDSFYVSIQESTINDVYIYALQLTKKGLTDTYFGYIQNF